MTPWKTHIGFEHYHRTKNENENMQTTIKLAQADFTRIDNDTNGNPRYYLPAFMAEEKNARKIGGVKYRGKRYGAGWVFQSYALQGDVDALNSAI
jgi:hypothetical protein